MTTAPGRNPDPVTPRLRPDPPASAVLGASEVSAAGDAGEIVKERTGDLLPSGLDTTTGTVPGAARSAVEIAAVTCVALINVVVRLDPFH